MPDLTPSELKALRFIVGQVEAGAVTEDNVVVVFDSSGAAIGEGKHQKEAPFTSATLEALERAGLIVVSKRSKGLYIFSLRAAAYDLLQREEVEAERKTRDDVLKEVYRKSRWGDSRIGPEDLATTLGRSRREVERALDFLKVDGMVKLVVSEAEILFAQILPAGMKRAEDLLVPPPPSVPADPALNRTTDVPEYTIDIFVSHRSVDEKIAEAFVELLEFAFKGHPAIRCTSVEGYMLEGGSDINATVQAEVQECKIVVALLTEESLDSYYVMFELGARWGTRRPLLPLRLGIEPEKLPGPLAVLNALDGTKRAQVESALKTIAKVIEDEKGDGARYEKYLSRFLDTVR